MGRKGKVTFLINPTPRTVPYGQEGIPNSQFLPEEQRIWTTKLVPQFFKAPNQATGLSNHLALKAQRACIHEPHRTTANKDAGLNRGTSPHLAYHLGSQKEKAGKKSPSPSLSLEGVWLHALQATTYVTSWCLRVQLLISTHLCDDCDPPQGPEKLVSTSPAFFPKLTPTIKSNHQHLLGKSLCTHLTFQLLQLPFKGQARPQIMLTLISQWGLHSWVLQDYSREAVFNRHRSTLHNYTYSYTYRLSAEDLPSSPWDWLLSQMLPESPAPYSACI